VNFLIGYHEPNECIKILFIVEAKILCLAFIISSTKRNIECFQSVVLDEISSHHHN